MYTMSSITFSASCMRSIFLNLAEYIVHIRIHIRLNDYPLCIYYTDIVLRIERRRAPHFFLLRCQLKLGHRCVTFVCVDDDGGVATGKTTFGRSSTQYVRGVLPYVIQPTAKIFEAHIDNRIIRAHLNNVCNI